MWDFFSNLFVQDFMPHGHCYYWKPEILWLNVVSDAIIGLSYFSIPFSLMVFVKKREDLVFRWMFVFFILFIFACGSTHFIEILTVWKPAYRFEGVVKAFTAIISLITAILLIRLLPQALSLPSPKQWQKVNLVLENEIHQKENFQKELQAINQELEKRVDERTRELEMKNRELSNEIIAKKNTEAALLVKNKDLERINRDLDSFIYTASHDLKTPLTNIKGLVDVLGKKASEKLNKQELEILARINHSVNNFNEILRDLTEISMVPRELNNKIESVDIPSVIKEVENNLKDLIVDSNTEIHYNLAVEKIWFNKINLRSIIYNLVNNSLKYQREGVKPEIRVSTQLKEKNFILEIEDNGIGIEKEKIPKIFEMFKRFHSGSEGTGVGLYLVKRVVDNVNGRIEVSSTLGKGTLFRIIIPENERS